MKKFYGNELGNFDEGEADTGLTLSLNCIIKILKNNKNFIIIKYE